MSRNIGTFNFAANLEGLLKAPIDAKQLVGTYADLTTPGTWNASGQVWLYDGAIVAVGADPIPSNNGVYWLCDSANYTATSSWLKAGSGSGTGTVSGATNGLELINSGRTVSLGGGLTVPTILTISGSTSLTVDDTRVTKTGIVYGGDYSTSFINESLVTRRYVDTIANGLKPKAAVKVATIAPVILSGLTQTIDTITPFLTGDRILVKNQISGQTNGIYSASTGSWGRTGDFDGLILGEVTSGAYMWVLTGGTNENTAWVLDTPDPIIVGVTPMNFVLFAQVADVVGGTGITVSMLNGVHTVSLNNATQTCLAQAITGVTNYGAGTSICFGKSGNNLCLNTIRGSGGTTVQKIGDDVIICSTSIGGTLTGATNGLHLINNGKTVALGGNLTGVTTINLCDNTLRLKSDTTDSYGLADFSLNSVYGSSKFGICSRDPINGIWGLSGNSSSISAYHCADASNGSCFIVNNTGLTITNKVSSASKSAVFGTSSFSYSGNYSSSNISNSRWIPDKEYVDRQISGCSNMMKIRIQGGSPSFIMTTNDDIIGVSGLSTNQLCLPGLPALICGRGQRLTVVDICGNALADPITINGNGTLINNGICSTINTDYGSITFVYNGFFWSAIAFVN